MKPEETVVVTDRRAWIKSVIRHSALGAIGAMVTYLVGRQLVRGCPMLTSHCGSCQLLARCDLPLAKSTRKARADKEQA